MEDLQREGIGCHRRQGAGVELEDKCVAGGGGDDEIGFAERQPAAELGSRRDFDVVHAPAFVVDIHIGAEAEAKLDDAVAVGA